MSSLSLIDAQKTVPALSYSLNLSRLFSGLFSSVKSTSHTMSAPLSPEVSGLITQLSELSVGLEDGRAGAREGLLGACSALISELAHPMESILMLMWAQVHFYSYQASEYPHSDQNALAYTSRCSSLGP